MVYQAGVATIDLANAFRDPDTSAVRFSTVLGNIDVELFSQQKPITVANFLKYVDQGSYFKTDPTTHHRASSFIHRSVAGFILQGGGFIGTVNPSDPSHAEPTQLATFPPIQNEPGISNKRGTIAMAKLSGNPNSATSQWFINLADNGGPPNNLDTQNGGFTLFGRVVGNGMIVADKIALVQRYNFGSPFDSIPLLNYMSPNLIKVANLVLIPGIAQIPPFTFTASSNDLTVAGASVSANGTSLLVIAKQIGTATIMVTAKDLEGASVSQHFTVNVVASPGRLANIATRLQVGIDPNALIAGFIIQGNSPKRLMIRAIGPSLSQSGIANPLADPVLELHDSTKLLATNDDWGDSDRQQIIDSGIAPLSTSEAAILTTLPANNASYTAIVRGVNNTSGVGLVELYDFDYGPGSTIANLSSRGFVQVGDNVMIGGFILTGSNAARVMVRAIEPSLSTAGITNPLNDPTLELHNAQGTMIASNNDWQSSSNASAIQATGIAPTNPRESAILITLSPSGYTAIVRGAGNAPTGVALVEVYQLP
jgi:cyclophilin family peptidyl-prolyl cis-trans isomerase